MIRDGARLEETIILNQLWTEIKTPSQDPCIYVPGRKRTLELIRGSKPVIDLPMIAKLALLNTVVEISGFQDLMETIEEQNSEHIDHMSGFLGGKRSSYQHWKLTIQAKLYNFDRAHPIAVIENLIVESIDEKTHTVSSRIESIVRMFHVSLVKIGMHKGLNQFLSKTEREKHRILSEYPADQEIMEQQIIRLFENMMQGRNDLMSCDRPSEIVIRELAGSIEQLHSRYGTRHSIYHFLEYLWIYFEELARGIDLSSKNLVDRLQSAILEYKNEERADRYIHHMPFVGDQWKPNKVVDRDLVVTLFERATPKPGDPLNIWNDIEECSKLSQWIIAIKDVFTAIFNAGDRTFEETKRLLLSDLARQSTVLSSKILVLKSHFEGLCSYEDLKSGLKFDQIALADLTSQSGHLRQLFKELISAYNKKVNTGAQDLNVDLQGTCRLSQITIDKLFARHKSDMMVGLTEKFWDIEKSQKQLMNCIAVYVREYIETLWLIEDDLTDQKFIYSDCRVDTFLIEVGSNPLTNIEKQEVPRIEQLSSLVRMIKTHSIPEVMILENRLLTILKNEDACLMDSDYKIHIESGRNIKCPFRYVLYVEMVLILKKLHRLYLDTKSKSRSKESKEDVLERLLGDNSFFFENYGLLAIIAENRDDRGILKLISNEKGEPQWDRKLSSIDLLKKVLEPFKKRSGMAMDFTMADVCAVGFRLLENMFYRLE